MPIDINHYKGGTEIRFLLTPLMREIVRAVILVLNVLLLLGIHCLLAE